MKIRPKQILIFVSLLVQILLAVSPDIKWVRDNIWAPQTSVNGFASTLSTYIGLQITCLGIMVALFLFDIRDQSVEATNHFKDLLNSYTPLQVRHLKENEFYQEFLGHCVKAKHFVKICYFAPQPPQQGAPDFRDEYYKDLIEVMKKHPNTVYRRIIRDTDANRKWASELVSSLIGTKNCSIAMLKDVPSNSEMPVALSVQIADTQNAWIVAVEEHAGSPMYRDVAIENEELTGVLDKYFDRLWGLSRIVFKPGFTHSQAHNAIFEER